MKRRRLLGAGALGGLWSAALPLGALPLLARAGTVRETRTVPGMADVARVAWSAVGELDIRQGDTASLVIDAEPHVQRALAVRVTAGTLELSIAPGGFKTNHAVRIALVLPRLAALSVNGSGTVTVGPVQAEAFELRTAGSGELRIERLRAATLSVEADGAMDVRIAAGQVGSQRVALRGAGDYEAAGLASTEADVAVSGSGSASVNAARALRARIDGSGDIDYLGRPVVQQSVRGSGSLTRR